MDHFTYDFMVTCNGVPQGLILGPILFTIYVNELGQKVSNTHLYFYADDTV